jgi:predicted ribosome quality control (RQC) complex YloA/Tae2 family protein
MSDPTPVALDGVLLMEPEPELLVETAPLLTDNTQPTSEASPLHEPQPLSPTLRSIRVDATSEAFEQLATCYRKALAHAERLWKRLERAEDSNQFTQAKKLRRKLDAADARLEAARTALLEHVQATARGEKERRRKRWSLRHERVRVSRVA